MENRVRRKWILVGLGLSCILVMSLGGYLAFLSYQISSQATPTAPSLSLAWSSTAQPDLSTRSETAIPEAYGVITLQPVPGLAPSLIASPTLPANNPVESGCVITMTGGLVTEMQAIDKDMPGAGTDAMVVPDKAQMAAWKIILHAMLKGDIVTACGQIEANHFPYHILDFTDIPFNRERYLVLEEDRPVTTGWGTYVIRREGVQAEVVVEAPHPVDDERTELEAVEVFRQIHARALLVAGTDRCANQAYSPCSGKTMACGKLEPYRSSDVAHASRTMFQAAHEALVDCGGERVALQLHGNNLATCPDVFVSNGTMIPHRLSAQIFQNAAALCRPYQVDLAQGKETECSFYNGASVQAVYSNGCASPEQVNACTDFIGVPANPEQFISIEQSMQFRRDYGCFLDALKEVWPGTEP